MTDSTNPSVPTGATPSTEAVGVETPSSASKAPLRGGTGNVSFDALESVLMDAPVAKTPIAKADKASEVVETPKEVKSAKAETATEPGKEAASVTEKVVDAVKKALNLKVGPRGREIELDTDTKIPVKIDGKDEEVSLDDLRNNYSGKVAYDKRFSELDARDKIYIKDKQNTEKQLGGILHKAMNNDILGALLEITDIAGIDPSPIMKSIQGTLLGGDIQKFLQMTPDQREIHFMKLENQFLRGYKTSVDKVNSDKTSEEALAREVAEQREALGVSDEWMQRAEAEIKSNPKAYEKLNTPKGKVELADAIKRWELAKEILGSVDEEFAKDVDMVQFGAKKLQGLKTIDKEKARQLVLKALKLDNKTQDKVEETRAASTLSRKVADAKEFRPIDTVNTKRKNASEDDDYDPRGWDRV